MHTGTSYATIATSITITTAKHHLLKLNTHPLTASYPVCFRLITSACGISTSELMTKITTTREKGIPTHPAWRCGSSNTASLTTLLKGRKIRMGCLLSRLTLLKGAA